MSNPHDSYEPTADARASARACRDAYLALLKEGFNEGQSLHVVGVILSAAIQAQKP